MEHHFDIKIATEYGIDEAIILQNIYYWVDKNRKNNKHLYEGNYWTYNSVKAFAEQFPYITASKIRRAIDNLVKNGLLLKGNFNDSTYDRTNWFALTDKAFVLFGENSKCICQNEQMELSDLANGFVADDKCYIGTDNKPDLKPDNKLYKGDFEFYPFEEFWNDYDKKVGLIDKLKKKWAKISEKDRLLIKNYIPLYKQAQPDKTFRKDPATFLNNKSWNDEIIIKNAPKVQPKKGVTLDQMQEIYKNLTGRNGYNSNQINVIEQGEYEDLGNKR